MLRIFKRFVCFFLAAAVIVSLSGCKKESAAPENSETITVYSTFYPLYALAELITKDVEGVRSMCLVQPQDGCLRNYQLSDWDFAMLLRSADAVICGGRGLESYESILYAMGEEGPAVTPLLHNMDLKTVTAEGIPEGEASHWDDVNPHIYMSIDGAVVLAGRISAAMQEFDPNYSEMYRKNYIEAEEKLTALGEQMNEICTDTAGIKVALLNEALVYFADECKLDVVLNYHRESGEDIDNKDDLIEIIKNSGTEVVLIEKQAPYALAEALGDAGLSVAKIDIMSTHAVEDGYEGYFEAQINNANALKTAADAAAKTLED